MRFNTRSFLPSLGNTGPVSGKLADLLPIALNQGFLLRPAPALYLHLRLQRFDAGRKFLTPYHRQWSALERIATRYLACVMLANPLFEIVSVAR
ncbi:MAG TPA: hypothetical protein VFH12_06965, partial [Pseudoxanthomonas sp.]|nr:hypothetical protein [Pseudoxanthomonas sp.]